MTLSFWIAAEKWYYLWAPTALGLIMVSALVMVFTLSKRKTKIGKRVIKIAALVLGGSTILILINNQRYGTYLEHVERVTPVIRHMQYKVFQGYQPMTRSTIDTYARYHDPEGVMATGLYNEETVTEAVTYLGKKHRHHYFQRDERIFKQYETSVFFDANRDETEIVGTLYRLKDPEFETIGFNDTHFVFYDRIEIAEEDTGKLYEPEDEFLVPTTKQVFLEWTFKYY